MSDFGLADGKIQLAMFYDARVILMYIDTIGNNLNEQEKKQSSYDDL